MVKLLRIPVSPGRTVTLSVHDTGYSSSSKILTAEEHRRIIAALHGTEGALTGIPDDELDEPEYTTEELLSVPVVSLTLNSDTVERIVTAYNKRVNVPQAKDAG